VARHWEHLLRAKYRIHMARVVHICICAILPVQQRSNSRYHFSALTPPRSPPSESIHFFTEKKPRRPSSPNRDARAVQVPVGQSHPAATTDLAGRRRSASATALAGLRHSPRGPLRRSARVPQAIAIVQRSSSRGGCERLVL
jgi:hypothetical protein